ncbi:RNHCP domain-containing protein [candidate division WWE3 bacterium]|jgi:hypothetical protein|nr:RNHCP domain-containing protein [candidate division WWE3 bacterium]MBT7349407.1 RNHCP domain-containing protein [candidate division WWE3 bacterium]
MSPQNKLSFKCSHCGKDVSFESYGTKNRNHCPFCLASLHVDNEIGDRKATCGGVMLATAKMHKPDGEEVLVHTCEICSLVRKNRVAGDDDEKTIAELKEVDFF